MRSIFSGIALVCSTALLITGNLFAGIAFAVCGFFGGLASAALRHHQEQETVKAIREFTEALKKNTVSQDKTASMEDSINQLGNALGEIFQALSSVNPGGNSDPWGSNNGGNNGNGSGWSH